MLNVSVGYRFLAVLSLVAVAAAQETRSAIQGRVSDPQNSPVADAIVRVTNVDTNVSISSATNGTGYYEANLLVAGNYQVSVEAHGFKKSILSGIVLAVGTRTEINIKVELGAVSESISVNAEAPLIDASGTVSTGRVMDTRQVEELPTFNNSALMLIKLVPGMQSGIDRSYNGTNGLGGTSTAHTIGNIGGNEWSLDGAPDMGSGTSASFLPISLAIQEFQVETTQFDASVGHTSGAVISVMDQGGRQRAAWSGALPVLEPALERGSFHHQAAVLPQTSTRRGGGNHALAQQLRASPMQPSGHNNTYTVPLGGPVVIPKVYNGRNKLFFFVSYDGFNDRKFTRGSVNHHGSHDGGAARRFQRSAESERSQIPVVRPALGAPGPQPAGPLCARPDSRQYIPTKPDYQPRL